MNLACVGLAVAQNSTQHSKIGLACRRLGGKKEEREIKGKRKKNVRILHYFAYPSGFLPVSGGVSTSIFPVPGLMMAAGWHLEKGCDEIVVPRTGQEIPPTLDIQTACVY